MSDQLKQLKAWLLQEGAVQLPNEGYPHLAASACSSTPLASWLLPSLQQGKAGTGCQKQPRLGTAAGMV